MCFRLGKIRVKISFLFFAVLTLVFAMEERIVGLVAIACVVLHELGHIVALLIMRACPQEISLGVFGVRIVHNDCRVSYRQELVAVLCGPLVNIALFVIFLALYMMLEHEIFMVIFAVNFSVGAFNLLPIPPLDGGRIMLRLVPYERAERIMAVVGAVIALVVTAAGAILAIKTGANLSLLATGLYLGVMCIKSIKI